MLTLELKKHPLSHEERQCKVCFFLGRFSTEPVAFLAGPFLHLHPKPMSESMDFWKAKPGGKTFDGDVGHLSKTKKTTPLKFNIAPEKWWLEDYFPIGKVTFKGLC